MDIADRNKERSTLVLAVLTLVVIGFTVLLSTRQTFRHQREAEEQHLVLTSRAVLLSVENFVSRGALREGEHRLSPRTAEFFQALEQDGDVLFVGLVDDQGENLLTSSLHGASAIDLPDSMVADMVRGGEWHGRLQLGDSLAYVYGKRMAPLRGVPMSLRDELAPPGFLVVGIDMDKHLGAYAGFRRNVLFQGLYILAAALLTWAFGWGLLKRREQAGKAAALERFQAKLLDNLPDGLITLDSDNLVHSVNPAALSILKLEARDILGRPSSFLPAPVAACISGKGSAGWRAISLGGAQLEVLALGLGQDQDNAWMLIIRDRTTLRNLEKSLAESEKLAAIGALAAGVAHEVRNPLSSLRGFAQYFVKKLAGRAPEEEYAKTMVREADRLNRVITDLLFLGRPKAVQAVPLNLELLCRDIFGLLRFDLEQQGVKIETALAAPLVYADPDALKQALLNLLLNSLDALSGEEQRPQNNTHAGPAPDMPLLPGLENLIDREKKGDAPESDDPRQPDLPDPKLGRLQLASGFLPGAVYIDVRDCGCGMSEEQKKQAFEAFFTDKTHGTGLGLALVRRTMLDHGGAAFIASAPGRGCTVRLLFPEACPEAESGAKNASSAAGQADLPSIAETGEKA
ncbi:PAS domain-containing protein [Desulfovibrio sp. OttesenSCG-928-M14]|nr:PAS domain-containing protein [Desulfovibrio sp. OttesenSCG-928-M14]